MRVFMGKNDKNAKMKNVSKCLPYFRSPEIIGPSLRGSKISNTLFYKKNLGIDDYTSKCSDHLKS